MSCTVHRYDQKDTSKLTLTDLQLLAAMGPPGGGRNPITARFLRHFNVISINEFNDETMTRIFSAIVQFYLKVRTYTYFSAYDKELNLPGHFMPNWRLSLYLVV